MTMKMLAGPVTADTTAETVYTVASGEAAEVLFVSLSQPATGLAKTLRLSIGADGVTTRVLEAAIPAGVGFYPFHVCWPMVAAQVLQLSSTADDDVAVVCISGDRRII